MTDTAHLHFVRESGSDLLEEGEATGGLPGKVQVRLNVGATVYGSFTIQTRYGSITGTGSGKLHGTGTYASFGGSMSVSRGTGRYAHVHGHGGFYGTLDRHTYAATIQTTGTLVY
ncbi:MAG TPA: autotransporter [Solirubrobacteraceae bacterium]|nr:autotransporter [Solirubrobacteraceae bacterium]